MSASKRVEQRRDEASRNWLADCNKRHVAAEAEQNPFSVQARVAVARESGRAPDVARSSELTESDEQMRDRRPWHDSVAAAWLGVGQ
jgi:hypothetical protein